MRAVKPLELRNNQRELLDLAHNGEILLVARPAKKNVVVMSEAEFNRLNKALRNAEYLEKLDRGTEAIKKKDLINVSIEELQALEK